MQLFCRRLIGFYWACLSGYILIFGAGLQASPASLGSSCGLFCGLLPFLYNVRKSTTQYSCNIIKALQILSFFRGLSRLFFSCSKLIFVVFCSFLPIKKEACPLQGSPPLLYFIYFALNSALICLYASLKSCPFGALPNIRSRSINDTPYF